MDKRRPPASLLWLLALALCAGMAAAAAILTFRVQDRQRQRVQAEAITGGDAKAGQLTFARHGCGSCHAVEGIGGADGGVGPDLTHVGRRATLAGKLANQPDAMIRLIMHPQAIIPGGGMPEMQVSESDARDIAAFLYAHDIKR